MAPGKKVTRKTNRYLTCDHCHSLVDFDRSGCDKSWEQTKEEGFTFQCLGCEKVELLTTKLVKLTDLVERIRRDDCQCKCKRNDRERLTEKVTGKNKLETVKKGKHLTVERTERIFMGDSILRKTDTRLSKGKDIVVCLPGARVEDITERVDKVVGAGKGGTMLVHVGTNNVEREGTVRTVGRYREMVRKIKKTGVGQIILSGILPVIEERGETLRNCRRMAINAQVEELCKEEGVGFLDLWGYFVGQVDMYKGDRLHLNRRGIAVFSENLHASVESGMGNINLNWI